MTGGDLPGRDGTSGTRGVTGPDSALARAEAEELAVEQALALVGGRNHARIQVNDRARNRAGDQANDRPRNPADEPAHHQPGDRADGRARNTADDQAGNPVGARANDQAGDRPGDPANHRPSNPANHQARNRVDDQASHRTRNPANHPSGNSANDGTWNPVNDRPHDRADDRPPDQLPSDPTNPHATSVYGTPNSPSPEHPWDQARALAARAGRRGVASVVRLSLDRALGHVLAEPLAALTDLPSFDTSAMDGWAVAGPGPWAYEEGTGLRAGGDPTAPLPDGTAVRIATGARIPADTTAVIRSEHAHVDEARGLLSARRPVVTGQDIRPRGQECGSGDQLVPAGTVVTPAVLGLAAAAGYDALPAVPRPRVDVLVLGDELLTSGLPYDGLIRDALGPMLGPWLRALGAEVSAPRRLGDDAEALREALASSDADLIVTTGGTAAGPVDHVHPVLAALGAELLVDGVAVRPGHPMLLALLAPEGPYLVGLPGNPLAAVSGLLTLAEPLLAGLAGRPAQDAYRALVHADVPGHPHDTRLVPVVHRAGRAGGRDHVAPLRYNGPAMLRGIAAADGLAVVPAGGVRSGTEVEILDLPWAPATPWTEGCFT
ncbi:MULTISPECIES: molybdopterin molybdotransferase MoeA [Streptomyces]|uniref:molybdopterin molybdotransferase MoeA n=1 Tax=Streptomyces TaxID=1883 RepID=UPI00194E3A8A|nr:MULTISPECIES: molybdopterin molybdotransferase MoeA [Streptomyces]